jgi:hypothetical protein
MPETTTSAKPKAPTTKLATAMRDEMIASVRQAQQFTLDAVSTWADVVAKMYPELPATPVVARSDVLEGLGATFGVAEELLAMQRKFATDLANVLVPVG